MKTVVNFLFVLASATLLATGCGKNDEPGNASDITGTYKGKLIVATDTIQNVSLKVEAIGSESHRVKLTLPTSSIPGIGEMLVADKIEAPCKIALKGDAYSLTGSIMVTMQDVPMPIPVSIDGTIGKDGKAKLQIGVSSIPVVGSLSVIFDGQKQ
jgi:hypothetical protein